ncbi:unnamed protein product, partial [Prorocentrum cordatum]
RAALAARPGGRRRCARGLPGRSSAVEGRGGLEGTLLPPPLPKEKEEEEQEDGERGSEEGARPRSHLPYSVVHSRRAVGSGSGVAFARCYCSRPNATTDPPDVKSACTGRKLLSVAAGASRGGPTPCRAFQERRRLRPRAAPPRAASADSSSTQGARPRHHTCGGGAAAPCERW